MSRAEYHEGEYTRHKEDECDIVCESLHSVESALSTIYIGTYSVSLFWKSLTKYIPYSDCPLLIIEGYEEILIEPRAR